MKIQPKDADDDIEIDMSPMIDMVFLLLIFFLVASTIIDKKVQIDIPTAAYATTPNDEERVVIAVNEDEEVFFGAFGIPVTLEELTLRLTAAKAKNEKLRVLIRSGGGVKYEMNEKIMRACGEAGSVDLIYAAYDE